MKTSTKRRAVKDSYLEMILRFPLRRIRNQQELEQATAILDVWLPRGDLDEGQEDYIRVLADLVSVYETQHHPVELPKFTPLQRLHYLVEQSGIKSSALAKILDCSPPLISLILNGKRGLSKGNILKLSAHFHMNAAYFL